LDTPHKFLRPGASNIKTPCVLNEENCIRLLKSGDQTAFREVVDHFRDSVFNTALGLLQNHEDAGDISQEVFIEVYQSVGKFRGDAKLSTWIYRITVQKSLEHIRNSRRKKRSGILLSIFGKENMVPVAASAPFYHPGVLLENKERAAVLFEALGRLPENQRTAFTLHKIESLSYAEIAEILSISLSSVESLMFRAKQNLQKLLSDYYEKNEK
jgi:RNA polymerase sigma factor (sigma-70 family)